MTDEKLEFTDLTTDKNEKEIDYTSLTAGELADRIRNRQYSVVTVLDHFITKAKQVHEKTNCVTAFLDDYATKLATKLDSEITSGKVFNKEDYPFLGVPISIKDVLDVEGYATVSGYKKHLNTPVNTSSQMIHLLVRCGAIPFCKTNVSQFCLSIESSNPVFGTTLNPYNPAYVSGGSTSGEGPLIKLKGSILGVGTDIGGSLRVPASFCGIYTIKPTPNRLPLDMKYPGVPGMESVLSTIGPMANSVEDIELFFKALLNKECWNFTYRGVPVPYRELKPIAGKKFRFGYFTTNGIYPATPASQRAVTITVDKLQAEGYECVPFYFDGLEKVGMLAQALVNLDNFKTLTSHITDEGIDSTVSSLVASVRKPNWFKSVLEFVYNWVFGQFTLADIIANSRDRNFNEILKLQRQRQILEVSCKLKMNELKIDGLICPAFALPPYKHGNFVKVLQGLHFSFLFNLFNMPAGVIPITTVDKDLDKLELDSDSLDAWLISKRLKQLNYKDNGMGTSKDWVVSDMYSTYDAEDMHGLPIGVQIAAKQFEDEKVIKMMKIIDDIIKN